MRLLAPRNRVIGDQRPTGGLIGWRGIGVVPPVH
jgi:hypothetical protein